MLETFTTPIKSLAHFAAVKPDQPVFIFLEQGEVETGKLTYADLNLSAIKIAINLLHFAQEGERALLILPNGLEFIQAIYGCLYAGIIPIPTNPPGITRSALRLLTIIQDAEASLILTTKEYLQILEPYQSAIPGSEKVKWVDISAFEDVDVRKWNKTERRPDDLAFIQYTSGSTNIPKGIMVTYGNLYKNAVGMYISYRERIGKNPVRVIWTPMFHDMGLLLGAFQTLYEEDVCILMTPIAFMQQPIRWLKAISRYRGTISGGPNFAFEICVNKATPELCEGLDLSTWTLAYNSAEPVRLETMEKFIEKFAPYGFSPAAMAPYYGLAEATLAVSGRRLKDAAMFIALDRAQLEKGKVVECSAGQDKSCLKLVTGGALLHGLRAAIVNPKTLERCAPDEVGEIWLAGESIAKGYWNRPEETEAIFGARIKDTGEGPFLRTGDMGFLHNGELYIAGRYKDLIIIRGRNYYPEDIEATVQDSHPALQPGGGAVFSLAIAGDEQLVVTQEIRKDYKGELDLNEVIKKIRFDIAREHGIRAYAVSLIKRGNIPKTSSGKIMRSEARKMYLEKAFDVIAEWRID